MELEANRTYYIISKPPIRWFCFLAVEGTGIISWNDFFESTDETGL